MKTTTIFMIMCTLVLSLSASADDFAIRIDAERDIWYTQLTGPQNGLVFMPAACHVLDIGDGSGPDDDVDLSAVVWFSYDDDYLYCYVEVKDDSVEATNAKRYLNDCIELKFDPNPSVKSTGPTANTRLTAFDKDMACQSCDVDNLSSLKNADGNYEQTKADYARRLTEDGYALEFRVPLDYIWTSQCGSLRDNASGTFGMAINIGENDGGNRTDMLQWSAGLSDAAHSNPALHGSVTFLPNHRLKLEAVSPQDPSIVNQHEKEWYYPNPNVTAWSPNPANGTIDVPRDKVFSWMAGNQAAAHNVYFGTSVDEVNLVNAGQQEPIYIPGEGLGFNQTYYWRINEVNDADTASPWEGTVWSFTTAGYVAVDDFEGYTDAWNHLIYQSWIDGYGWEDPNGSSGEGNGTGSAVGYWGTPTLETDVVYDGAKSMPLSFGLDGKSLSETTRTWATPIPASVDGIEITNLVLQIYGDVTNIPGQLFLEINGQKVSDYPGPSEDMGVSEWHPWPVNLKATGITSIESMTIGITGGFGTIYVDAIRLYPAAN